MPFFLPLSKRRAEVLGSSNRMEVSNMFLSCACLVLLPVVCLEATSQPRGTEVIVFNLLWLSTQVFLTHFGARARGSCSVDRVTPWLSWMFSWTDLCISYFLPPLIEGKHLVTFSTPHFLPAQNRIIFLLITGIVYLSTPDSKRCIFCSCQDCGLFM